MTNNQRKVTEADKWLEIPQNVRPRLGQEATLFEQPRNARTRTGEPIGWLVLFSLHTLRTLGHPLRGLGEVKITEWALFNVEAASRAMHIDLLEEYGMRDAVVTWHSLSDMERTWLYEKYNRDLELPSVHRSNPDALYAGFLRRTLDEPFSQQVQAWCKAELARMVQDKLR